MGFGFTDRPGTPQRHFTVINHFKAGGSRDGRCAGYLAHAQQRISAKLIRVAMLYRAFDIIRPWGRSPLGTGTRKLTASTEPYCA